MTDTPYHSGEISIHEKLGIAKFQEEIGKRMVRPFMPDQHREFFAQLPFFVLGSVDNEGWPWASVLFAQKGFVSTPDEFQIRVDALPSNNDPLASNLLPDKPVSFLGIELHTRRRNRANAHIIAVDETGFTSKIDQSFGNCPQYINHRKDEFRSETGEVDETVRHFSSVDMATQQTIEDADFFFVASHAGDSDDPKKAGADVNHRGGVPGFVEVEGNTLIVPDYRGNNAFNTLGNLVRNPKAGLTFYNPRNASLVQMVGRTEMIWDDDPYLRNLPQAQRAWRFHLEKGIERFQSVPMNWQLQALSPSFKRIA